MIASRRCAARSARFGGFAALPVCADVAPPAEPATARVLAELAVAIFRDFAFAVFMKQI
jgi:hypothetical protein